MYLFYETLPESITVNTNSVITIDSCVFRNGVDVSEKSSGLSISFYNAVEDKANVFAKAISKRSTVYVTMPNAFEQFSYKFLTNKLMFNTWGHTFIGPSILFYNREAFTTDRYH